MPYIEQQYSRVAPPGAVNSGLGSSGGGDAAVWRSAQRAGEALTDVGTHFLDKMESAKRDDELSSFEVAATEAINRYKQNIRENPDPESYKQGLDKTVKSLENEHIAKMSHGGAKKAATRWLNEKYARWAGDVQKLSWERQVANQTANMEVNYSEAVKLSDKVTMEKVLLRAVNNNLISADKAAEMMAKGHAAIDKNTLWAKLGQIGWNKAEAFLSDPQRIAEAGIDPETAKEMLDDVRALGRYEKDRQEKQTAKMHAQAEKTAWNLHREGRLTPGWVEKEFNAGRLSKADRDNYIKRLNSKHPILTDRAVKWDVKEMLRDYRLGEITYRKVESKLKNSFNSLSDEDLNSLQTELYESQKKRNSGQVEVKNEHVIKAGLARLKAVHEAGGVWGDEEDPETAAVMYGKRAGQWEDFWKNNPDATQAEAQEFLKLLTEDVWDVRFLRKNKLRAGRFAEIESEIKTRINNGSVNVDEQVQGYFLAPESNDPNSIPAPQTQDEFERMVGVIEDDQTAREYYERYISQWQ